MLFGSFNAVKKSKDDEAYVCPHTVVYKINVDTADLTYKMALWNSNSQSAAFIDWGDGQSEYLKTTSEVDFEYFLHTYPAPSTYVVKFDLNSVLRH